MTRTGFAGEPSEAVVQVLKTLFADMVVRKGMSTTDARKSLLSTEPFQNYPALVAALDHYAGDAENANEGAQ